MVTYQLATDEQLYLASVALASLVVCGARARGGEAAAPPIGRLTAWAAFVRLVPVCGFAFRDRCGPDLSMGLGRGRERSHRSAGRNHTTRARSATRGHRDHRNISGTGCKSADLGGESSGGKRRTCAGQARGAETEARLSADQRRENADLAFRLARVDSVLVPGALVCLRAC